MCSLIAGNVCARREGKLKIDYQQSLLGQLKETRILLLVLRIQEKLLLPRILTDVCLLHV